MLERWLLYVLRAEPNPFSKLLLVYPFAFRLSASVCRGADSVCSGTGKAECQPFVWARGMFCRRAVVFAVLNEDSRTR